MRSLADQFCPNVHDAPITAAAHDPRTGAVATADARGVVAVKRRGEAAPGLVFQQGEAPVRALGFVRGGAQLAVGDDAGSVAVYEVADGRALFEERREGARGRVRAMRGIALSPEGSTLAAVAIDGLVRVWDLVRAERTVAWRGFGGRSVAFDARGDRLLCLDEAGQPRLVDLRCRESVPMDRLQMPAEQASFNRDHTMVVCSGPAGLSLLRVADGALAGSVATRGGSGIIGMALSPRGDRVAVVTQRSVHVFTLPELTPCPAEHHGAPDPAGAAIWAADGVEVGGEDGLMHSSTGARGLPPLACATGFGTRRVAVHGRFVALWDGNRRIALIDAGTELRHAVIDRNGGMIAALPERGGVLVLQAPGGRRLVEGDQATFGAPQVAVGGSVVAARLRSGGVRWWKIDEGKAYDLEWAQAMALSGGGTWLGVVTPRGQARILDPATGRDAVRPPTPLAEVPIRLLAFVNRRPDLLIVDREGVLGHYDLAASIREDRPGEGRDLLDFEVEVDGLWGVTGGRYGAVRLPEGDRCTVVVVDLRKGDVVAEVGGLDARAWVDSETGAILEPARAGAILERDLQGRETRVLRSLPGDQWIAFGPRGVLAASEGAGASMS